ncbi:MAG: DUF4856 domain-containing protein [Saprospiraceae bacterium]|nr:DUF4856 domain-containing protein [Saprospiraceae bacterium]
MLKFLHHSVSILVITLLLTACGEKDKAPLTIPAAYDGTSFSANNTTQDAVRSQLEALVTEIKNGRNAGTIVEYATLLALYASGDPSLKSITTPYYAGRLEGTGNWLDELAKASGGAYTLGTPTGQGGTFGGYLFDENGLEHEQLVEKGLFGAALYNHAVSLMQGSMTPATADQLLRIFGAHPDFPNTPTAANAANPDKFMANYAARRDKNDGTGLYSQMKNAFIKLQAALKAGDDYNQERDEALVALRENWEKVNAGTMINYCHSVISTLSATNPTDAQKASALHAYSECVGFIHGWRTISPDNKLITDAEIDEILVLFNAPFNGTPASFKFATDPINELPKLTQVITKLKTKYGFSDQEVEDFRHNWVAVQGR